MSSLTPPEVEALIPALNSVGRYEKDLFLAMAEIVKVRRGRGGARPLLQPQAKLTQRPPQRLCKVPLARLALTPPPHTLAHLPSS